MTQGFSMLRGIGILGLFLGGLTVGAEEAVPTPQEFLKTVREPFQIASSWRFNGSVLHQKKEEGKQREPLAMGLAFNREEMRSVLLLGKKDVYRIRQKNSPGNPPDATLEAPEKPQCLSMAEAGLTPDDLTFAFIYWDFAYDLKFEDVRGQKCRVLELKHPRNNDSVTVWFSVKYGFPLQVYYYHKGEENPWRILEFKDFKEYEKDFWFVKTLVIRDPEQRWRTQVDFEDAAMVKLKTGEALPSLDEMEKKVKE